MVTSLAALVAAFTLLSASATSALASTGLLVSQATVSVVAFDDNNGTGNNGNGNQGHANQGHGHQGHANNGSANNANENEDESSFRGRHSSITGCVASSHPSHVFTLQTNAGLITVQPTGNALNRINANETLTLGRIVTAQGHFAGNGVYIAQQLSLDGFASNGACAYAAQPFPTPGTQPGGNVVVRGTIQSVSGNSLRLSTTYGVQTVVYDANTLVVYANAPVGSGALRAGESVTIVGLRQNNGSTIYARTIQIQSGIGLGGGQNAILTGIVINTNIGASQFTVFSGLQVVTVDLTPQTVVQRGGTRVDPSAIRSFARVTVYGNRSGNVVTATVVQL